LNLQPIVWLGKISYSLYLWQELFIYGPRNPWYFVLFAVALASLSYYLIEQPMLRVRERRARERSSPPTAGLPAREGEREQAGQVGMDEQRADLRTAAGF